MTLNTIPTWLDKLAARWEIEDGRGGKVRSFRVFEKNEMPMAITAGMAPCAVSYPTAWEIEYSMGGPTLIYCNGQTDFHLTNDVKDTNIPYLILFFDRIVTAAAAQMTLGGAVRSFTILQNTPGAISLVTYPNDMGKDDHQGLRAQWRVAQDVSGQLTVGR